jgi:hypothetical protein
MKPEARAKFLEEEKQYDTEFRMKLLKDIPYFHHLYTKYNDPEWLSIAKNLGIAAADLKRKIV